MDTGLVTDEDAGEIAARKVAEHRFRAPLDIVDGARWTVDRIIVGAVSKGLSGDGLIRLSLTKPHKLIAPLAVIELAGQSY